MVRTLVRVFAAVVIGAALIGCRTMTAGGTPTARPELRPVLLNELYELSADLGSPGADPVPAWAVPEPPLNGLSEVTLQRTSCLGECAAYQVTFRSDGTAEYWGGVNAPRQGRFRASANGRLNHLAAWGRALGVFELSPTYSFAVVDAQDSYVSFVKDGTRKILFDPGSLGPIPLYA